MRILIIKLSALGDIAHALPTVDLINETAPNAEIHWLVESRFAPLVKLHQHVDVTITVNTRKWREVGRHGFVENISEIIHSFGKLKRQHYDLVIDLQGNVKSGIFTAATMAHARAGFPTHLAKEKLNVLATNLRPRELSKKLPIRKQLKMLTLYALRTVGYPELKRNDCPSKNGFRAPSASVMREAMWIESLGVPPEHRLIGIHAGTTWQTKRWSTFYWAELARRIVDSNLGSVILFWGNEPERKEASCIRAVRPDNVFLWRGGSLRSLVAALTLLDLFVAPDTGPLHIAGLVGTPTVSLYRATSAFRNSPDGPLHRSLQSPLPCSPCLKKKCVDNDKCVRSITVGNVFKLVSENVLPGIRRKVWRTSS